MPIKNTSYLKSRYETGDIPTQQDFYDLIDSFFVGLPLDVEITNNTQQINPERPFLVVTTDSGNISLINDPQILTGENGQELKLIGESDTNYVVLSNNNGLLLTNSFSLKRGYVLHLVYLSKFSAWVEISRGRLDHGNLVGLTDDDHPMYLKADGGRALSGNLSAGNNIITNLGAPNLDNDVTRKKYVDDAIAPFTTDHGELGGLGDDDHPIYLRTNGSRDLGGDMSAGGHNLTGLATPLNQNDATNKAYVDSKVQGLEWQESILDKDLTTPPGSPSIGDRYLVAIGGSGAWLGHDDNLAEYNGSDWDFTNPATDMAVWVEDEDKQYTYNGVSWVLFGSTVDHGNLIGLSDDDHIQYLRADGTRELTGTQSMGGFKITTLGAPASDADASTKKYVDDAVAPFTDDHGSLSGLGDDDHPQYALLSGSRAFTGTQSMGGFRVTNISNPSANQDAATKSWVESQVAPFTTDHGELGGLGDDDHPMYIRADGIRNFNGPQNMGGYKITGVGYPSDDYDSANKIYVDDRLSGLDWQESVIDRYDPTPGLPSLPNNGNRYLCTVTASGWVENRVYQWNNQGSEWVEIIPDIGFALWVENESKQYTFNGSDWVLFGTTLSHSSLDDLENDDHLQYLRTDGTRVLTGDQSFGNNKITNLSNPVNDQDAVNKQFIVDSYINKNGASAFTANQSMGGFKLTNLGEPTISTDAVTKGFLDGMVQGIDWQESVLSRHNPVIGLPGGSSIGDRHLSTNTGNGWVINRIYEYNGSVWEETIPIQGFATWVEDENKQYTFNGSAWVLFGSTTDHGNLIGLGDDDHTQYLLTDGTRALAGNQNANNNRVINLGNPVDNQDAVTKLYLQNQISTFTDDHGEMNGLLDDDHTQYLLTSGARAMGGNLSMGDHKITNLGTPTVSTDASTKDYVDSKVQGLEWQKSVIDRWDPTPGLPTTPSIGDRYLSIDNGNGWSNGYIYEYDGVTWSQIIPNYGFAVWVENESKQYTFNGIFWVLFGSTVDHGNLIGLGDDDHPQYLRADGTRALTGEWDTGQNIIATGIQIGAYGLTSDEFQHLDGLDQNIKTTDSPEFNGLSLSDWSGVLKVASGIVDATADTDDLPEGIGHLYFTDQRATDAITEIDGGVLS